MFIGADSSSACTVRGEQEDGKEVKIPGYGWLADDGFQDDSWRFVTDLFLENSYWVFSTQVGCPPQQLRQI